MGEVQHMKSQRIKITHTIITIIRHVMFVFYLHISLGILTVALFKSGWYQFWASECQVEFMSLDLCETGQNQF